MTSIETKIPDALYRQAQAIAQREDITLDELIAIALASQVSVWQTRQTFPERAARGDWENARQILANAPDDEPEDRDNL
jgi:hypothetical protein